MSQTLDKTSASRAVTTVLDRLQANRATSIPTLSLVERGPSIKLDGPVADVLKSQSPDNLKKFGLDLAIRWDADGYEVHLRAGGRIGSARFVQGRRAVDVIVEPKIGNANFLRMLEASYGQLSAHGTSTAYKTDAPPSALLLEFTVGRIQEFVMRQRFRSYALRHNSNARNPRGHLHVGEYLTKQVPRLRPDVVPCSYFEFSHNVFENQILARTLLIASRISAHFLPNYRNQLAIKIALMQRFLQGVDAPTINLSDIAAMNYTKQNAHFRPLHELCAVVLSGSSVSLSPGRKLDFMSFTLSMDALFERYVYQMFAVVLGKPAVKSKKELIFQIHGTDRNLELDGLIECGRKAVVECKYKVVEKGEDVDFDEGRMRNADIFQSIAYAVHREIVADEVILVYPSADSTASPVRQVATISAFESTDGTPIPIRVLLLSLAKSPSEIVSALGPIIRGY